jgi:8-oxo-dGTP pyrophosphatase MutT (NUDIX family)
MKFKNIPNSSHLVPTNKFFNFIIGLLSRIFKKSFRMVWDSRSVAVNGVIILFKHGNPIPYVLASIRGPKAADYTGSMNLVAGYLDRNEDGTQALYREAWEETGLDLKTLAYPERDSDCIWSEIIANNLEQPWHVKTDPYENRQNISLRYGIAIVLKEGQDLPLLSLSNNEVHGEVEYAEWLPVNQIDNYIWAFGHDKVIKNYLSKIDHLDKAFCK